MPSNEVMRELQAVLEFFAAAQRAEELTIKEAQARIDAYRISRANVESALACIQRLQQKENGNA